MSEKALMSRVTELEHLLQSREDELSKYRIEVSKTNQVLAHVLQELQGQLKVAQTIQRTLSPTEFPQMPGFEFSSKFEPGSEMGGDYFDFFELPEKMKFALTLSCASGYGLSALLLSLILKVSARLEGKVGLSPEQFFAYLKDKLQNALTEKDSASMFYAVFDRKTLSVKLALLGEIAAFHFRAKDRAWVRIEASAGPIKSDFSSQILQESIKLDSKDRLVLCSPGLKLESGWESVFKILQRLQPTSSVHDVRNELMISVQKQLSNLPPKRDLTVLVLEVKDQVLRLA